MREVLALTPYQVSEVYLIDPAKEPEETPQSLPQDFNIETATHAERMLFAESLRGLIGPDKVKKLQEDLTQKYGYGQ